MKYRVLNEEISYPTDPDIVERLLAGEAIPFGARGLVSYRAGDVVDDIPACSVESLLAECAIETAEDASGLADPVQGVRFVSASVHGAEVVERGTDEADALGRDLVRPGEVLGGDEKGGA